MVVTEVVVVVSVVVSMTETILVILFQLAIFATKFEEATVMYVLYITMEARLQPVTVMKVSVTSIVVFKRAELIGLYILPMISFGSIVLLR